MTPVERIARALCRLDGHPENATMNGKPLWQDYLPEARAALTAISEAFDASGMVEGVRQMVEMEGSDAATRVARIYDEVIDWLDAAASESP